MTLDQNQLFPYNVPHVFFMCRRRIIFPKHNVEVSQLLRPDIVA